MNFSPKCESRAHAIASGSARFPESCHLPSVRCTISTEPPSVYRPPPRERQKRRNKRWTLPQIHGIYALPARTRAIVVNEISILKSSVLLYNKFSDCRSCRRILQRRLERVKLEKPDFSAYEMPDLVHAVQAGEEPAFVELRRRFSAMAHNFAYKYLRDYHLAQDVVQEAFFEALRCLPNLQEPAAFPAWFRRILFKHCDRITRVKKLSVVPISAIIDPPSHLPVAEDAVRDDELRAQICELLESLPPHERIVAALYHINGYSQEQVAQFIGVPVSTVKNRIRSSRIRLQKNLPLSEDRRRRVLDPENRQCSQAVISSLLIQPRPLEISGHPVQKIWDTFNREMGGFHIVSGDEIEDRDDVAGHNSSVIDQLAFFLNGRTILRLQMFDAAIRAARNRKPPYRIMAPGRVYCFQSNPGQWSSNEADGLVLDDNFGPDQLLNQISGIVGGLLDNVRIEVRPLSAPFFHNAWRMFAREGSKTIELAEGGVLRTDVLTRHGCHIGCASPLVFGLRLDNISRKRFGSPHTGSDRATA